MARFRGTVCGGRGEASRLGHGTKGLTVTAQSYNGDVIVSFFDHEGEDHVAINVVPHSRHGEGITLYHGSIATLLDKNASAAYLQATIAALAPEMLVL